MIHTTNLSMELISRAWPYISSTSKSYLSHTLCHNSIIYLACCMIGWEMFSILSLNLKFFFLNNNRDLPLAITDVCARSRFHIIKLMQLSLHSLTQGAKIISFHHGNPVTGDALQCCVVCRHWVSEMWSDSPKSYSWKMSNTFLSSSLWF